MASKYERLYEVITVHEIDHRTTELELKLVGGPVTTLTPQRGFGSSRIAFTLPRQEALAYNVGSFFWLRLSV